MDKLSAPRFAVQCGGHAVKMERWDGRWAYRYPDGGLGFPDPTEEGLSDYLQKARGLIYRLIHTPTHDEDRLAAIIEAADFVVSTGVLPSPASQSVAPAPAVQPVVACPSSGYIPAPPVTRAAGSAAEPPVLLSRADGPTLDSSVAKEDRKVYVHLICQAHAINALVDAVKQLRRQQAGGSGG